MTPARPSRLRGSLSALIVVALVAAGFVALVGLDRDSEAEGAGFARRAAGGFASATGEGFWLAFADGEVEAYGDAQHLGDASSLPLNGPVVGGAVTPAGDGYWLVAADGGIFTYGGARFLGSLGSMRLNEPVFSMAPTPSGDGYWLVAYDGGIFAFGDAPFLGSMGGEALNQPVVGITTAARSAGYRMVAADGGIFAFNADFYGSLPGSTRATVDVVAMAATSTGRGYWIALANGDVVAYGDAPQFAAYEAAACDPVIGLVANPVAVGYRLLTASGGTVPRGDAPGGTGVTGTPGSCAGHTPTGPDGAPAPQGPAPSPSNPAPAPSDPSPSDPSPSPSDPAPPAPAPSDPAPPAPAPPAPGSGWPDATNTGVTNEAALVPASGKIEVTEDGTVIENLELDGFIAVEADNVVIRNVRIRPTHRYGIQVDPETSGTLIEDTEIAGGGGPCKVGVVFGHYTARRMNVHGCFEDGFRAGSNTVIEDSWVHDLALVDGSHNDAVQSIGGTNVVIRGNRLEGPYRKQTSAIIAHAHIGGDLVNLVIEDNLLSGGTYTLNIKQRTSQIRGTVIVRNNVWVRDSYAFGSHVTSRDFDIEFSGNTFDDGAPYAFDDR